MLNFKNISINFATNDYDIITLLTTFMADVTDLY